MNAKKLNVTAARIAYFKTIKPSKLSPAKATKLLGDILVAHDSYFDILWKRVVKRDKAAAKVLGALAGLAIKAGKWPRCAHSIIPPGVC